MAIIEIRKIFMTTLSAEREISYFNGHASADHLSNLTRVENGNAIIEIADVGNVCAKLYTFDGSDYKKKIDLLNMGPNISVILSKGTQYALDITIILAKAELERLNSTQSDGMIKKRPLLGALARIDGIPLAHQVVNLHRFQTVQEKLIEMHLVDKTKATCSIVEIHKQTPDGQINSESLIHLPTNTPQNLEIMLVQGSLDTAYRRRFSRSSVGLEIDSQTINSILIAAFSIALNCSDDQ